VRAIVDLTEWELVRVDAVAVQSTPIRVEPVTPATPGEMPQTTSSPRAISPLSRGRSVVPVGPTIPGDTVTPETPAVPKGKSEAGESPPDWSAGSKRSFVHDSELPDLVRLSRETSGEATVTSASEVPSSDVVMGASSGGQCVGRSGPDSRDM